MRLALAICALLLALPGCEGKKAPPPDAKGSAAKSVDARFKEGVVNLGDKPVRVVPFVGHNPRMDLKVQCLRKRDDAKKRGDAGPTELELCFEEGYRDASAVKVIRVEYQDGATGADAIRRVTKEGGNDGAHFLVEPTGSIWQILDVGHATRRGGEIRGGEVRVLSGSAEGHKALLDALQGIFPDAAVEIVAIEG